MSSIVVLTGNLSATSRTAAVLDVLALRLTGHGHDVHVVPIRELPPGPLLAADVHHPAISDVVEAVAAARGLIVASPVYKAAYTGLLKAFLDLLPQYALAGKTVLPLVTGGTPAHVLAVAEAGVHFRGTAVSEVRDPAGDRHAGDWAGGCVVVVAVVPVRVDANRVDLHPAGRDLVG
jgi:NAD(P)H-dependent FMN reductase